MWASTTSRKASGMVVETGSSGRHQLLDEERVAAAAAMDLLDELAGRPSAGSRASISRPVSHRSSGRTRDPFAVGATFELGEQRAQGVAAVQLVVAERPDEQQRTRRTGCDQRRQHHPRRRIGPVEVLDHERAAALAERHGRAPR